ncbi:unnamed protein product [Musa acuminata subsp. burmannicoides]
MASSALSPFPPFSSLHHRQQRHLRTSASPSSLPAALFPLFGFPNADPHRRRTSLLILSSSSSNARPAYGRELERKQEILESHGLDPSDFISLSAHKLRRRRRDEENRAGKGKRMPLPLDEPKPPPRTTHRLLQVLGGKARRKKLLSPKGMDVRPMMEVVRGAAFDILQVAGGCPASLRPGRWLDLYSGTGSVGIEAISRGCSEVHFVEMDPWVVSEVLQPNLEWTGFSDVSVIHTIRVERFLEQAEQSSDKNRSFDYISVTPPYMAVDYTVLMDQLGKSPLVGEDCFILVEYPLKTLLADSCGHLIKIADRRFGRTNLVERPRPESVINENEIRITSQGVVRNYVSYATSLLQEKRGREIVLKAMGQAISKAVAIAEIIKKRFSGLYQDTTISSVSITDVWEPIEEGLVPLEMTRHVSMISISLSTRELNKNSPGYQAPLQVEQPKRQQRYQQFQQSQQQQQFRPKQTQGQHNEDSYAQGHGRGRGGRGRGWGRGYSGFAGYENNQGGYGNYQGGYGYNQGGYGYNQARYGGYGHDQENGGWNSNWGRGGGRSRGNWNYHGGGYGGGRGGGSGRSGGRGYGRGRGRMGGRGRGNQF